MAVVPGDSPNVVPILPEWAKPTPADFLQAAAITHQRIAMDVERIKSKPSTNIEYAPKVISDQEQFAVRSSLAQRRMREIDNKLDREGFPPPPEDKR